MVKPPRIIAWELTWGCNLACVHCRGSSTSEIPEGELSTSEAKHFVDEIVEMGDPILILTGGEPLVRKDVYEIARYATDKGLRVALATNGTLLNDDVVKKLKDAGVQRVSISIDGSTAQTHDDFRGVPGAFESTMRGIEYLKAGGLGFQINTTITKRNVDEIPAILEIATKIGAEAHHIFLLVPTGRGKELENEEIPPAEYERVLNWFYDQQKHVKIQLKATCAPHYFRIMRQRAKREGTEVTVKTHGYEAMTRGCLGGISFCFVSSTGDVQPCGYLPVVAGNVKENSFKEIWEDSVLFNDLRDYDKLGGKCGRCSYKSVCGGCRARAYAATGDYMAEEPYCIYNPR
ncbi:heme b synthase [Methanococcoides alaskense]|uniref:Heme b synthase n=1 Tax=Methanococcoides alaskense TaxID=325778 RepID=A0AA90TXP9_9EURY|nr:heme b synthase [Methanococcoides alaskense]MDA0525230.1 heme b synthase [Methanococcoides alaskense]MDR6221847.1 heme b synthase [Methanococcoides alaskense]